MVRSGRKDDHEVHFRVANQVVCIGERVWHAAFAGDLFRGLFAAARDGDDLEVWQELQDGNVTVAPPVTHADQPHPYFCVATLVHLNSLLGCVV